MRKDRVRYLLHIIAGLVLILVAPLTAFAKKQSRTYPEEGKVTGTSINQVERTRTYRVVTDARTYELDCGKHPELFSSTPGECGGDKKLQIGDVIHFRIEKGRAYIPVPETVESSGEQGLRILHEEVRSSPADHPAIQSAKTGDAKP
jgi:hypothetical protein